MMNRTDNLNQFSKACREMKQEAWSSIDLQDRPVFTTKSNYSSVTLKKPYRDIALEYLYYEYKRTVPHFALTHIEKVCSTSGLYVNDIVIKFHH